MAWFIRAIEDVDGRWRCQHGRHVYDDHESLSDALTHLRSISVDLAPAELYVHHGDGTVQGLGPVGMSVGDGDGSTALERDVDPHMAES